MKELYRANGPTPYGQKTHPDLRYLKSVSTLTKKRKFFNGDELMEGPGVRENVLSWQTTPKAGCVL